MLCIVSNDQRQFLVTRDRYPWMDGYPWISSWMDMDTVSPNPSGYGYTFAPMDIHPYPSIPSSAFVDVPASHVLVPIWVTRRLNQHRAQILKNAHVSHIPYRARKTATRRT